uniref:Protein kinase domain-containing protein n=1 Tax=Oryzias latipes TaxID=8090 RepID=A0A3P9JBH3_ORYLA
MVNGVYLYSAFYLLTKAQSALQSQSHSPMHTHIHTHTDGGSAAEHWRQPPTRGKVGFSVLPKDTSTHGRARRDSNLQSYDHGSTALPLHHSRRHAALQIQGEMSRIERNIQGSDDLLPVVLKSGKRTYLRENKLGQGSFGKVLHYKIQNTSEDVAVKFIKRKEGLKELKMLKKINAFDPDKNCFLKMLDHFEYKSLICVVFEKLDQTLSDIFLKRNQRPFDVCELRPVAQQLLVALRALKTIGLVHCDIKLNNVMFVNHQSYPYKVKLIDFGLAREKTSLRRLSNIQIVGYKAPEVVFDCPLDEAVDMWSVGCVLAGMYKAKHFYPRTCLYDYIASIIHMQGQPPDNVLLKGSVYSFRKPNINEDQSDVEEFKSLIKQMLCVDQKTRITPEEALNHNFFTMKHLSEGTKDPYVTSAREIMSVCEPVTTMQPDAPKRHPEHSVQNSTTGKSTCGHTGEKRRDVLKDFFARKLKFSAAKRREPTCETTENKDSKDVKRSTTSTRVPGNSEITNRLKNVTFEEIPSKTAKRRSKKQKESHKEESKRRKKTRGTPSVVTPDCPVNGKTHKGSPCMEVKTNNVASDGILDRFPTSTRVNSGSRIKRSNRVGKRPPTLFHDHLSPASSLVGGTGPFATAAVSPGCRLPGPGGALSARRGGSHYI